MSVFFQLAYVANAAHLIVAPGTNPPEVSNWFAHTGSVALGAAPGIRPIQISHGPQPAIGFPVGKYLQNSQTHMCQKTSAGLFAVNFNPGTGDQDQAIAGCYATANDYVLFRTENMSGGRHLRYTRKVNGVVVANVLSTFQYSEGVRQWIGFRTNYTGKIGLYWFGSNGAFVHEYLTGVPLGTLPAKATTVVGAALFGVLGKLEGGIEAAAFASVVVGDSQIKESRATLESLLTGNL